MKEEENLPDNRFLTTMFWNVWFDLQNGKRGDGEAIFVKLEKLIREYQPDVIGLNEIFRVNPTTESVAERVLKSHGYNTYFDYLITAKDGSLIGSVIASRLDIEEVMSLTFAEDSPASFNWYQSYRPTALRLRIRQQEKSVQIIVPHFPVILPKDLFVHRRQRKAFNKLLEKIGTRNTIIGGDFNEYKSLFRLFGKPEGFGVVAGSLLKPTWRLNAAKRTLVAAAVDYVLYDKKNDLKLKSSHIVDGRPSDHSPLIVKFEVK